MSNEVKVEREENVWIHLPGSREPVKLSKADAIELLRQLAFVFNYDMTTRESNGRQD